jgi:hypothetical protein
MGWGQVKKGESLNFFTHDHSTCPGRGLFWNFLPPVRDCPVNAHPRRDLGLHQLKIPLCALCVPFPSAFAKSVLCKWIG